jgi:hypothetical protein
MSQCIDTSDIIAIAAILIAIITPLIQTVYERRREWHGACELLFRSMDSLYEEIKELAMNPNKGNHISYQHCLNRRKNLLEHYGKRFFFQKRRIRKSRGIIIYNLMSIPENVEYEELINKGFTNKKTQNENYVKFIQKIRNHTMLATDALIK